MAKRALGPGQGREPYPQETRERALELAEEIGPVRAAKELGIPYATLKHWRAKAGRQNVPSGDDPASWVARKREGAGKQLEIMRKAAQKVLELLDKDDMSGARNAMVVGGIAVDKGGQLEEAAARHEERQARLSQAQAEAIAGALRAVLDDLDRGPRRSRKWCDTT